MLNRRILRVKAFKVLYSYAENPDLSLKDLLASLTTSEEATRDLYLFLLALVPALTAEAARRTEAARGKFNPTQEELHPNTKFVDNAVATLLNEDPDFQRLIQQRKISWEQNDAYLFGLWDRVKTREYFAQYMASEERSLPDDAALWKCIFQEEFEEDETLDAILEDASLYWSDELPYVLNLCIASLDTLGRTGRWDCPPLYQSEILRSRGRDNVESDRDFVRKLLGAAYARFQEYNALIASSVSKWDLDRLFTTDIVLIALGLAEAETFPDIPLKVSINEYVEISKYYSTPKSRGFVNGLLDKLLKERVAQGIINKSL